MDSEEFVVERKKRKGLCGKIMFFEKKTAQTRANFLVKKGKERYLRVYHCPDCDAWHLTHQRKNYEFAFSN